MLIFSWGIVGRTHETGMVSDMVVVFVAMHSTWLAKASYHDTISPLVLTGIGKDDNNKGQYLALRNISLKMEY